MLKLARIPHSGKFSQVQNFHENAVFIFEKLFLTLIFALAWRQ